MRLRTDADIAAGLAALARLDPRLAPAIEAAGEVALRRRPAGFEGLARIVVAQQITDKAADAIWTRLSALGPVAPKPFLAHEDGALRAVGLSAGKVRTLRQAAEALRDGRLDLDAIPQMPPEAAVAALTRLHGVGPWTAEIYLLFSLGHPDIFPAGDLALQVAAAEALGLEARPGDKALRAIAARWSPHRSAAAHLFWRTYHLRRDARRTG